MRNRKGGISMNPTVKILRMIGSPFASGQNLPENKDEDSKLYDCAEKNKIGLLYLEALKKDGCLNKLQSEYEKHKKNRIEHLTTAVRISSLLNSQKVRYAVIKSIMPFPYVPNDVDILVFDSPNQFEKIINTAKNSGYDVIGKAPMEVMIHDARNEKHKNPKEKDVYDIDLYRELGAINIIYFDKNKLEKHVTETKLFEENIKVLRPGAELATVLVHSIFPEQIFTLHLYYTTLHYLSKMNAEDINDFIAIIKENNITFAVKTVISIIAILHDVAHGFIPEKLKTLTSEFGMNNFETTKLRKKSLATPHIYMFLTIIITLLEKMREKKAAKSIVRQMLKMLNPKTIGYVVKVVAERRQRDTY